MYCVFDTLIYKKKFNQLRKLTPLKMRKYLIIHDQNTSGALE